MSCESLMIKTFGVPHVKNVCCLVIKTLYMTLLFKHLAYISN